MSDAQQQIRERVRAYIVQTLLENRVAGLGDDTPLIAGGILDSFSAMMLANYVEEEFGVALGVEGVEPHDVATVGALAATIERMSRL